MRASISAPPAAMLTAILLDACSLVNCWKFTSMPYRSRSSCRCSSSKAVVAITLSTPMTFKVVLNFSVSPPVDSAAELSPTVLLSPPVEEVVPPSPEQPANMPASSAIMVRALTSLFAFINLQPPKILFCRPFGTAWFKTVFRLLIPRIQKRENAIP